MLRASEAPGTSRLALQTVQINKIAIERVTEAPGVPRRCSFFASLLRSVPRSIPQPGRAAEGNPAVIDPNASSKASAPHLVNVSRPEEASANCRLGVYFQRATIISVLQFLRAVPVEVNTHYRIRSLPSEILRLH